MQTSQMICFSCRRQLLTAALQRAQAYRLPQLKVGATYSSAAAGARRTDRHFTEEFVPSIEDLEADGQQEPRKPQDDGRARWDRLSMPRVQRLTPRAPSKTTYRKSLSAHNEKDSLGILKDVVTKKVNQANPSVSTSQSSPPELVQYYDDVNRMRSMMKEEGLEKCLEHFMTKVWPKIPANGHRRLAFQRGTYLAKKLVEAKFADMDSRRLPSLAQITKLFQDMNSLTPTKWADMTMGLIGSIVARSPARDDYTSDEDYQVAMYRKAELVDDLVDSWIIFQRHRLGANYYDLQRSDEAEFRLPQINDAQLRKYAHRRDLPNALAMIFFDDARSTTQVPAVALATFVMLVDSTHSTFNARRRAKPLLTPIARILSQVGVGRKGLIKMLSPHPDVLSYVLQQWDTIIEGLRSTNDAGPVGPAGARSGSTTHARREAAVMAAQLGQENPRIFQKQVTDALAMGDAEALEAAWAAYETKFPSSAQDVSTANTRQKMYDYFIMAFTALKRPQRAIDIWDTMASSGLQPTLETWTCMLEGCRRAKNPSALENVWKRLVASGTKLDIAAWTTRITGLMECGQPKAGLRALKDMLYKSHRPDGVPLQIGSINAALGGLIRLNSMEAAEDLLSWASENGVEPDIITYNTLLRPLVRQGNSEGVKNVLLMMDKTNVLPDGATWTILIQGLIDTTRGATPAVQRERVQNLLSEMEAMGAQSNLETFGRMIFELIAGGCHTGHHTQGPIGAVWAHIRAKGLHPSPHIYTMLADSYFERSPVPFAEINSLFAERLELDESRSGRLDRVFWERIIKGFAQAGYVDRAYALFIKVSNLGTGLTLSTLEVLLKRLVASGKKTEASHVVETVRKHRAGSMIQTWPAEALQGDPRLRRSVDRTRYWKHGFWVYAYECGLLSMADWTQLQIEHSIRAG